MVRLESSPVFAEISAGSTAAIVEAAAPVSVSDLLVLGGGGGHGHITVLGGRGDAPPPLLVEHQHGGAPLEAGVATLTRPVSVAGLAQGNVAIGVILAESY